MQVTHSRFAVGRRGKRPAGAARGVAGRTPSAGRKPALPERRGARGAGTDTRVSLYDEVNARIIAEMEAALASGSAAVEAVGLHIGVDMAGWWQAHEAFLDLIRDREVLVGMIGEVAGAEVAKANAGEKTKVMKAIIADSLAGTNGRTKVENWVPARGLQIFESIRVSNLWRGLPLRLRHRAVRPPRVPVPRR